MKTKDSVIIPIVVLCSFLLSVSTAFADQTTLRQVGKVQGTFSNGAGILSVENIQTTFRNVGEVTAENISVVATLPDGKKVTLSGPSSLLRKKKAIYTYAGAEPVTSNRKLKAKATCDNCR